MNPLTATSIVLFLMMTWQFFAKATPLIVGRPPNCNSRCESDYFPVCGTDGRTYPNLCFLFKGFCINSSLALARPGPCLLRERCNFPCNRIYDPVCSTDGITYSNPCELMYNACLYPRSHIRRAYYGSCNTKPKVPPCPPSCNGDYRPVCGSNGITYTNQCLFNMVACDDSSLTKVYDEACGVDQKAPPCPPFCSRDYYPVCGSDDVTYTNQCNFNMAACKNISLKKVKDTACDEDSPGRCSEQCTREYFPVCGSDFETYSNECLLNITICRDPTVTKLFDGRCESSQRRPPCPVGCTREYLPVCGSDGVTYSNQCSFNKKACKELSLTKVKDEACSPEESFTITGSYCPSTCSKLYDPVCGSDGVSYDNLCLINMASCKNPSIYKVHNGRCDGDPNTLTTTTTTRRPLFNPPPSQSNSNLDFCNNKDCGFDYKPICGTDGVTYTNKCTFDVAVCKNASLKAISCA